MARKKILIVILLFLTAVNFIFFIKRDQFQYFPYVNYTSLYYGNNSDPLRWKKFNSQYPESEKLEVKRITDSVIDCHNGTLTKAFLIGNFLHNRFKKQLGKPSIALSISTPLIQYRKLSSDLNEKVWCGNLAQMFSYFCYSQGITCRYIEIMQPGDHHVVNECFLAETNEWVLMDLTFNYLLIQNADGAYLNLISFKNSIKQPSNLFALNNSSSKYQLDLSHHPIQHYYNNSYPIYYYHSLANGEVYSLGSKLARYFLPTSWYKIYDDKAGSNIFFYIKVCLFLFWLLAILFTCLNMLKND